MVQIKNFTKIRDFSIVLDKCRRTIGKDQIHKEPTDSWKAKIILAEHSPIRLLEFDWTFKSIKMWVTTHLVRHHEGCEKFVSTQRTDRTGIERDNLPQGIENDMDFTANAQALINISRKRLCSCASRETRQAWLKVKEEVAKTEPILAEKMVKECIYRGFCPEFFSPCGYDKTPQFKRDLVTYRNVNYNEEKEENGNQD